MSVLNSFFNRGLLGAKCKTCLNLAISRIKLLRNKREVELQQMRKEISQFLQTGQDAIARIRAEHIVREQNVLAAYEILELFCEFVLARVPILESQRDCPSELQEAIASIIYASPRCSDLPELTQVKNLLTAKYGKEFVAAASELRPDTNVNRAIIEKLSVQAPPADVKLKILKGIAQEYNVKWDASSTKAELNKKHEDLLDGLNSTNSRAGIVQDSMRVSLPRDQDSVKPISRNQEIQPPQGPAFGNRTSSVGRDKTDLPVRDQREGHHGDKKSETNQPTSDVLEKARAAIASADRASTAARAAAELVKVRLVPQSGKSKHSA